MPDPSSRSATFAPDEVVAGRFRIVRFLAAGGMGEVYEAEDLELSGRVALKTLRPEILQDPRALERFRREIQVARQITHPNVCRTFDVFRHRPAGAGPEVALLSMELLAGETLAERLRRGPLTTAEALPLVRQIAAGLQAAHEAGVVHRDFKSGNVLLVPTLRSGREPGLRAVVTDFGLAHRTSGPAGSLTEAGALQGTPAYMAPEQLTGGESTPAVDVYALGVVLYEMVTGQAPFSGDTPVAALMTRLSAPPPSPRTLVRDLDPVWEAVILRCLEREPGQRFGSAVEVVRALDGEPPPEARRRRRGPWLLAAALAGVTLAAGAALWLVRQPAASPRSAARRAVAVLDFKNVTGQAEAAWISAALAEMLRTELGAGDALRVVPGESVARMANDLALPASDSLARDTLARVGAYAAADVVVVGTYLALDNGRLRVDLRVQDTASGETTTTLSESASIPALLELVAHAGAQLRARLGVGELAPPRVAEARAAQVADPEAARLYAEGLARLRAFDALGARDLLERAIAAAPEHPLPRAALAQAWSVLGYDARAAAEARRAAERAGALPREQRLWVEARAAELSQQWAKAIDLYRSLWNFFPDELDYGLRLAAAQVGAGRPKDALSTVEALRGLPAPQRDDARIDLAEADAAEMIGDFRRQRSAGAAAATKGEARGARFVVERARAAEAAALERLGQIEEATRLATEAQRLAAEAGDRSGEARALGILGSLAQDRGDPAAARTFQDQALAIALEIGEQQQVSALLNSQAILLSLADDFEAARRKYEEALAIHREVEDRRSQARVLNNIARTLITAGDLAPALERLEASLALSREVGNRNGVVHGLASLAMLAMAQGDPAGAAVRARESLAEAREIGNQRAASAALAVLAEALLQQDDLAGAAQALEEAMAAARSASAAADLGERRLLLARLALARGQYEDAIGEARQAAVSFGDPGRQREAGKAQLTLARALLASGRIEEASAALERARPVLAHSNAIGARLELVELEASLLARRGDAPKAARQIREALSESPNRGGPLLRLRLELALGAIERSASRLGSVEAEAQSLGLLLLARQAREARSW